MKTYIVLLRGVNVSGKNKVPMANLRKLLIDLGFKNATTYIQSGNIILTSEKSKEEICSVIKQGIASHFGVDVPVLIRTVDELKNVIANYPFSITNEKIVAFTFLNTVIEQSTIENLQITEDKYKIANTVIYLYCPTGFGKTKLTNTMFEKKLKVTATTRNYKTTIKLLELAIKN